MSTVKSSTKAAGTPKKLNPYQEHMKKTLKELKAAAARSNKPYNHKDAFKAAAAAWSAKAKMLIELMTHAYKAPSYATEESAGMDLYAAVDDDVRIAAGRTYVVPTGIKMVLPGGHEGQIRPRSGLAAKYGVTVLNAPGTVDEDYRGEVKVILINLGQEDFVVQRGMRIAQMVVARYKRAYIYQVDDIRDDTTRGAGGFGSTGAF